jgi:hypothetical protein
VFPDTGLVQFVVCMLHTVEMGKQVVKRSLTTSWAEAAQELGEGEGKRKSAQELRSGGSFAMPRAAQ